MNRNKQKNVVSSFLLTTYYLLLTTFLIGCVTVPVREALPTYNINGITYLPLISLCEQKDINWQYDTFSRTVNLSKGPHRINFMVGDKLVLVNGSPKNLKHPVDIYQGTVVVPYRFKEEIIDTLFKESFPKAALPLSKIRKVVIDPGHGGTDPGAIGRTGLREKDVTLDIAKRLRSLLRASGIQVVMTRSIDTFVPLSSRVDITNKSQADLFISIHANANRVKSLKGFEIYYISAYVDDCKRAMYAAQNTNLNLKNSYFASHSHSQSQSLVLKAILWDMVNTYNRAKSVELGRSICKAIAQNLNTVILGIRGANYYVLKGIYAPAVLIEVGFLSNYNEERLLKNSYYRQQITQAIAQGIQDYSQELVALTQAYR